MKDTKIEWTDRTWNPVNGCTKISQGCKNCYAEAIAERFRGPAYPNGFKVTLKPNKLDEPRRWKEPAKVFVNSMSDVFHEDIPDEFRRRMWETMGSCPQHTFQILTKRADIMREWVTKYGRILPNVWLGVSVEDHRVEKRIALLKQTPAAIRFISAEPLIGCLTGEAPNDLAGIDWVIIGGESGPGSREMVTQWALDILHDAKHHGCAVFVKQLGSIWARKHSRAVKPHSKGGDPSEWWGPFSLLNVREFPKEAVAQ